MQAYGKQDYWFSDPHFLSAEWPNASTETIRNIEQYIDSKQSQAFSQSDIDWFLEAGCSRELVNMLLVSQLRHLVVWESTLLLRYCLVTPLVDVDSVRALARSKLETSNLDSNSDKNSNSNKDPHEAIPKAQAFMSDTNRWLIKTTEDVRQQAFEPPWDSHVLLPEWLLQLYWKEWVPLCDAKYDLSSIRSANNKAFPLMPVVQGSASGFSDVYGRDEYLSGTHVHTVVCLENGKYAGHIFALHQHVPLDNTLEAIGIRSSLGHNIRGTAGEQRAGIAVRLLEGVHRFAVSTGHGKVGVVQPLDSMVKLLEKNGFDGRQAAKFNAGGPFRDVSKGSIADIDSFYIFSNGTEPVPIINPFPNRQYT